MKAQFHPPEKSKEQFRTPADLEARWQVSGITLRRWRAQGRLKASKFGRGVRFHIDDVIAFEEAARC